MVTSDFRAEVEMRPFCACAMHPAIIIGTVRSLIVDVAMGQIPRSTERISSCISYMLHHVTLHCRQNDDLVSSTDGEVFKVRREVVGSVAQRRHQQHDVYCVDYYTSRISHSHCTLRAAY